MNENEVTLYVRQNLVLGKYYELMESRNKDRSTKDQELMKRMRPIQFSTHVVVFEDEKGIKESFKYIDVYKILNKQSIE